MASEVLQIQSSNGFTVPQDFHYSQDIQCTKLGDSACTKQGDSACKDQGDSACRDQAEVKPRYSESLLRLPAEMISMPLGFSIDSGGSVTKLIYRSNQDYKNGVRINGSDVDGGVLRLVHVPKSDLDQLPDFLIEHCDIMNAASCVTGQGDSSTSVTGQGDSSTSVTSQGDSSTSITGQGDGAFWYQTGVGVQHYMIELDNRLNIRTRLASELSCLIKALIELSDSNRTKGGTTGETTVPVLRPQPVSLVGLDRALSLTRAFLQMTAKYRSAVDLNKEDITCPKEGFDIEAWGTKLFTSSAQSLSEELSVRSLEFPQMVVLIGSALVALILNEDGKSRFVDMNTAAGKTTLGLGLAATGAKSFEELISLASRGQRYAVDLVLEELGNKEREKTEEDFYSLISSDNTQMPVFLLGKLTEEKHKGSYTREDLAVGILKMFTMMFAKQCIACAQLWGKTSIVFVGSFLQNTLIRDLFEENFHYESLVQPFYGKDVVKMGVMEHSGHLCALGTWMMNAELNASTLNSTQL